jgi:hypothetical protein
MNLYTYLVLFALASRPAWLAGNVNCFPPHNKLSVSSYSFCRTTESIQTCNLQLYNHIEHKGKVVPGSTASCILDFGTRWKWVFSFTLRLLYPQKNSTWHPLNRKLGGLQSRSERGGEEKNSWPLAGLEPPIIQLVAQCCTTPIISGMHTKNKLENS